MRNITLIILCILGLSAAQAEVYRWVDENGKVHYGDRPPVSQKAREIDIKATEPAAPPPTEAERAEKRRRLLNVYRQERQQAREAAEKEKQARAEAQRNCSIARDRLEQIERASYLYDLNEKGGRVAYSDERRVQATAKAKADVARWCG